MLEPPAIRIGWLRMLLKVFRRHNKGGLYETLIRDAERMIADAERERQRPN
jgi:hypothetical protein